MTNDIWGTSEKKPEVIFDFSTEQDKIEFEEQLADLFDIPEDAMITIELTGKPIFEDGKLVRAENVRNVRIKILT